MADHYERKGRVYRRVGHAPVGHTAGTRPDRNADRGHRFAATELRCPDGAGVYSSASGRGDRGSKGERGAVRPKADEQAKRL